MSLVSARLTCSRRPVPSASSTPTHGSATMTLSDKSIPTSLSSTNSASGNKLATGWYPGWVSSEFAPSQIPWAKYSSLTYAFAYVVMGVCNDDLGWTTVIQYHNPWWDIFSNIGRSKRPQRICLSSSCPCMFALMVSQDESSLYQRMSVHWFLLEGGLVRDISPLQLPRPRTALPLPMLWLNLRPRIPSMVLTLSAYLCKVPWQLIYWPLFM